MVFLYFWNLPEADSFFFFVCSYSVAGTMLFAEIVRLVLVFCSFSK